MAVARRCRGGAPADQEGGLLTRLFSYVVRYDVGFAPNPFHGSCTLATCKPRIRQTARAGDWVMGTAAAGQRRGCRLVYAMRVDERLTFQQYWDDPRFRRKRPTMRASLKMAYGDNIYRRDANGQWLQEDSRHTLADGSRNLGHVLRDTSADAVLISWHFSYFGGDGPAVPVALRTAYGQDLVAGRGHRCRFSKKHVEAATAWLGGLERGYLSDPADW